MPIKQGMKRHKNDGFTLVELLVACVLIGVLTSIAIPVFLTQRTKAYRSAMRADLRSLIVSEVSWNAGNDAYTADLAQLTAEGYRPSHDVTAHVAVSGSDFVVCTKHPAVSEWLVYDSATSTITSSAADCA